MISWTGHGKINTFHSMAQINENSCKNMSNVKCLLDVSNQHKNASKYELDISCFVSQGYTKL